MSYALITGGSGGIGYALARELAKRHYNLLLVARSETKLQHHSQQFAEEFGIQTHYLAIDLTTSDADKKLTDWIIKSNWPITVLINNAGYALWGELDKTACQDTQNMMQLNMNMLVSLCRRCIPLLKQHPQSYILNVASTTAYQAIPSLSVYAATKAFVVAFTRGLRWELKGSNISVSCLSPGATTTDFMNRAGMEALKETADKVSMTPNQVASIAINGMFNKKAEIIPGLINKVSVGLIGLLPKWLPEKIAHRIYTKREETKS